MKIGECSKKFLLLKLFYKNFFTIKFIKSKFKKIIFIKLIKFEIFNFFKFFIKNEHLSLKLKFININIILKFFKASKSFLRRFYILVM